MRLHFHMRPLLRPVVLVSLPFGAALASAQNDLLNIQTTIGSFRMIDGKGTATFTFEGTVLLADVQGDVKIEGAVKKEYDDPKLLRRTYFGKGKMTITGKWRAIQWFGTNMKGTIKGTSIVRIVGEFDKNLDTGWYWYGNDVANRNPWYTVGMTISVPLDPRMTPKPTRRGGYGG